MARPFIWTPEKEQALTWTFQGGWTQARMAARLGVTRRTVEGWTRRKAWQERAEQVRIARKAQWEVEWKAKLAGEVAARRAESETLIAADLAAIHAKYGRWAK